MFRLRARQDSQAMQAGARQIRAGVGTKILYQAQAIFSGSRCTRRLTHSVLVGQKGSCVTLLLLKLALHWRLHPLPAPPSNHPSLNECNNGKRMREKTATTDDDDADLHIGHGRGVGKRDRVQISQGTLGVCLPWGWSGACSLPSSIDE